MARPQPMIENPPDRLFKVETASRAARG